jgi:hypothetical protein
MVGKAAGAGRVIEFHRNLRVLVFSCNNDWDGGSIPLGR